MSTTHSSQLTTSAISLGVIQLQAHLRSLYKSAISATSTATYKRAWKTFRQFQSEVLHKVPIIPIPEGHLHMLIAYLDLR